MLRYSYLTVVLIFCVFTTTAQLADSVDVVKTTLNDSTEIVSISVVDTLVSSISLDSTLTTVTSLDSSINDNSQPLPQDSLAVSTDTLTLNSLTKNESNQPSKDSTIITIQTDTSLNDTSGMVETIQSAPDSMIIVSRDSVIKLIETIDSLENHISNLELRDSAITKSTLEAPTRSEDLTSNSPDSTLLTTQFVEESLKSSTTDSSENATTVKPDPIIIVEPLKNAKPDYDHEVTFSMRVVDSIAKTPVPAHVELHIIGKGYDEISTATCDQWGKFSIRMTSASQFEVVINAESFMTLRQHIDLSTEDEFDGIIEKYFKLQPLKSGSIFVLNNMNFRQGDHELPKSCHQELDKLVTLLNANPKMVIKLGGHTDNTASLDASVRLSLKRVNEVRYYLIQKGIKLNRIKVQGYGSSRPLVGGTDPESQKKNRRVDCEILRF